MLSDLLDGFTTTELAERDYGVVIGQERRALDEEATRHRREQVRAGAAGLAA